MIAWCDYAYIGSKQEIKNDTGRKNNKAEERSVGADEVAWECIL
jgi:hypothetical protein